MSEKYPQIDNHTNKEAQNGYKKMDEQPSCDKCPMVETEPEISGFLGPRTGFAFDRI